MHDYYTMCRNLKPTSTRVLIDMGASLSFHGEGGGPMLTLLSEYEKFGFHFGKYGMIWSFYLLLSLLLSLCVHVTYTLIAPLPFYIHICRSLLCL